MGGFCSYNLYYSGAYLTGGYFGVRAGLQSQWTIDVDLLMVLAALGAAIVNAPFEGAMLLFLFSLLNVLQAYAIDRTRRAIKSLMKLRPEKALSRHARHVVYQNLSFALAVIIFLVISALGFNLMLPIGVVAHEGSTVLVCLNGLRLLSFRTPSV